MAYARLWTGLAGGCSRDYGYGLKNFLIKGSGPRVYFVGFRV